MQAIADGAEAHVTPEKVLEAFDWGWDIVCQDAAILMHVLPKDHKLFRLPVFLSKEFLDWAVSGRDGWAACAGHRHNCGWVDGWPGLLAVAS